MDPIKKNVELAFCRYSEITNAVFAIFADLFVTSVCM